MFIIWLLLSCLEAKIVPIYALKDAHQPSGYRIVMGNHKPSNQSVPVSCDEIYNSKDPCAFAQKNCSFDSVFFNTLAVYYCSLRPNKPFSDHLLTSLEIHTLPSDPPQFILLYILLILPLIIIYFYILYLGSQEFLTPSLSLLSKWLRLSPTVAGVTLLAFGNGAPDFFTALSASSSMDTISLMLGGSLGSGLFITIWVFGFIIIAISKNIRLKLKNPSFWLKKTKRFLTRHSNPSSASIQLVSSIRSAQAGLSSEPEIIHNSTDHTIDVPDDHSHYSKEITKLSLFSFTKHFLLYLVAIMSIQVIILLRRIPIIIPIVLLCLYTGNIISILILEAYKHYKHKSTLDEPQSDSSISSNPTQSNPLSIRLQVQMFHLLIIDIFENASLMSKILTCITAPIYILLMLSIPPLYIDEHDHLDMFEEIGTDDEQPKPSDVILKSSQVERLDNAHTLEDNHRSELEIGSLKSCEKSPQDLLNECYYVDQWRLVLNPIFSGLVICTFFSLWNVPILIFKGWMVYLITAPLLSLFFLYTTSWTSKPIYRKCLVFFTFTITLIWIYGISAEIILLFKSLSILLPFLSSSFLGLTLLSWGNSFGDWIIDFTLAKSILTSPQLQGFEIAITGVFCGPLQNVMLSLSISLLKLALQFPGATITLDPTLEFAGWYLIGSLLLTGIFVILIWKCKKIHRWYGILLCTLYLIFMIIATLGGFGIIPQWNLSI